MNRMHKIYLSEAELNRGNVIVDSGTTDTYFSRVLGGPFRQIWKELTGNDYNHSPISITDAEIAALPTIILVLSADEGSAVGDEPKGNPDDVPGYAGETDLSSNPRDVVLAIPAAHYLEYYPDIGKYVPRFYTDEEGGGSVIGANAMMGHNVFFDNSRKRIGFAESNCDYTSLLLSEGPSQNSDRKIEVPVNEEPVSEVDANETDVEVGESEAEESESRGNSTTVEVYVEQNTEVPIIPKPADNNNNTNEVPANPKDKIYAEKENNYQFYEDGE